MAKISKKKDDTWDLSPLFAGDNDPQIEWAQKECLTQAERFVQKWRARQDYLTNPKALAEALKEYETWLVATGDNDRVCYYFWLRSEQEKNNPRVKAGLNQAKDIAVKIENDTQFFALNLSKIAKDKQKEFLGAKELEHYRHWLERLFAESRYLKSDAEEKIINYHAGPGYQLWVNLVESLLARETRGGRNFPTILADCANPKKATRVKATKQINDILSAWAPVAEQELNAVLEYKKITDEIRGVDQPETLRLVADDMEPKIVETMLEAVEEKLELARRYYRLKAKLLKQKQITYFERAVPIGKVRQKWSYVEAQKLTRASLAKLDDELAKIFDNFIKNRQIDVFPRAGKADGAFCVHQSPAQPTYILLNHTNQWRDVKTLAHEIGHGLNNELMRQNIRPLYFGTPTCTAEVASTFFEDWVLAETRANVSPKEKLALLMSKLDDEVSTIFRQVMAYRFEQELHRAFRQKGYLAKEEIGALWLKWMKKYTGPAVKFPTGAENWWVYWSHFRQFFYVYSYASGLLIAKTLQAKVRAKPMFIKQVKKFLGAGLSTSPKNLFLDLGLDITQSDFWQIGLDDFARHLAEAEKLAGCFQGTKKVLG